MEIRCCTVWWQVPGALERFVRDLLSSEMARLRPAGWSWPNQEAGSGDVHLIEDIGADSLEILNLAAALTEGLDLRDEAELRLLQSRPSWDGWVHAARLRLQRDDERLHFSSSGSTGRPQRLSHRIVDLQQEMRAQLDLLMPGGAPRRIISAVRSHHIYGFLFTILLPLEVARRTGVMPPVLDLSGQVPGLARSMAIAGDLLVGHPAWWSAALRGGAPWPAGVRALSSTAPCPPELAMSGLEQGLARWIEIYGSTETAGIGWRDQPGAPFRLLPFWRRCGTDQGESMLQRHTADGHWATAVQPPDHLEWSGEDRFTPIARRDGVIQVGGTNVDPTVVRQRLLQHPLVADAAVRAHRVGAEWRLKAFVVPRSSQPQAPQPNQSLESELLAWCREQMVSVERPVHIRVGSGLPRNEMGKLCDWPVPEISDGA